MAMVMPMRIESKQLLLLLSWMSPSFPTGSFAYSHGLEWAIEDGTVANAAQLKDWISDVIMHGSGWNDAVMFANCWSEDASSLNELALAYAASRERWLETTQLGSAFQIAASVFSSSVPRQDLIAYPVAAGLACSGTGIDRIHGLLAFLQGFVNSLVSVAVRLVPLGQTQGLETIRDLMPLVSETAHRAANSTLDDLGSATIASDIASMRHETLYSRVFRT